jgi:Zn-dependent protease
MWLVGLVICAGWIFSLCLHEFSHALVAYWGGDTSVKSKGYLTFNPLKYTDPGYSIALPILFLLIGGIGLPGGAVYINHHKLRNRWWQTAVSAAGPAANIFTAILLAIYFHSSTGGNLELSYQINNQINENSFLPSGVAFLIYLQIYAAIFNLLPIPGLDGYGIIEPWLRPQIRSQCNYFKKYNAFVIVGLLWCFPLFSFFTFEVVGLISEKILRVPSTFVGLGLSFFRHPLNQLITLVVLLIFCSTLNPKIKFSIRQKNSSVSGNHKTSTKQGGKVVEEKAIFSTQVHPETRKRAIALAGYEKQRIERLLNSVRLKNPDRSEQWYWEKIIYDMERDRGF